MLSGTARAHDPIFGLGPHVLYKGGVEVHLNAGRDKAGNEREDEAAVELTYGLTGDWAAGSSCPTSGRRKVRSAPAVLVT